MIKESLALYAFSWQFDGNCGYAEAGNKLYKVCPNGKVEEFSWGEGESWEEVFGVNEDLSEFYEMIRDDPLLWCIAKRYPGLRPRKVSIWAASVIAVAQQNASFKQAWKALYKLHILKSKRVKAFGREYLLFPKKEDVDERSLREAGFGYRYKTIMELKKIEVTCENVDELKKIKGIGDYSLGLIKLFGCRDYSALILDRWLKAVFEEAYGDWERIKEFGKWKGLVSLLTTVALDAVPLRKALARVREGKVCPVEDFSPLTMWKHL